MKISETIRQGSQRQAAPRRQVIKSTLTFRLSGDYEGELDQDELYSALKKLLDKPLKSLHGKMIDVGDKEAKIFNVDWNW